MLTIQDISYSYGKHPVLQKVSFSMAEGELIFLLGANGAGKSTLFNCILGLLPGWKGDIRLLGRSTRGLSAKALAKQIAYIPQSHHPTFSYQVIDMVLMGTNHALPAFCSPGPKEEQIAYEAMEQIGITHLAQRDFQELSGGEQQMVLIARALAQKGKILLMDEPTSSLDYGNQLRVLKMAQHLARKGYSVLISCHNPQQAMLYADRVIALHEGRIVADGRPEQALTPELIKTLYQVSVQFVQTGDGVLLAPDHKRLFQWTPDMIRFMEDAGSRTDFYRMAAEELAELVPSESFVCDVGCGLGFSSLELAKRFRRVRAVDISSQVLAVLREKNPYDHLECVEGDAFAMELAEKYDAMLFCCCGQVDEVVKAAREQCSGTVMVIQKDGRYHRLTPGSLRDRKADFGQMEAEFAKMGVPFRSKRITVHMGQPLRSLEDGVRYFRTYNKGEDPACITETYVQERVITREDPQFPYYYPMETVMGILHFHVKDLPPMEEKV